jgi:hypothetical protein
MGLVYGVGSSLLAKDVGERLVVKSVDESKLTVTEVLTYPEDDKAGDYIHPTGGDYSRHEAMPWIGFEHLRWHKSERNAWAYPDDDAASDEPVVIAWARDSREQPGGKYSVRNTELTIKGQKVTLPVATSYFDPSDRLSMQVFAMVADDTLPGVSVEIKPSAPKLADGRLHKSFRERGPSPLEQRNAYEVFRWDLHGFVHCKSPVNSGALTVQSDRLIKAVQVGKIGSDPMHPLLLKSLQSAVPARKYFAVKNLLGKAMPDEALASTSVYDEAAPDAAAEGTGASEFPTADSLYALAQAVTDVCESAKSSKGEHKKGQKALRKLCDKLEAIVQEAVATAENVEADLSDDAEDVADVEATDEAAAEVDTETDDDGLLKCLPDRVKLLLKAKRFTLREIHAAERGDSPEDLKRLEKARKTFARAEKLYS